MNSSVMRSKRMLLVFLILCAINVNGNTVREYIKIGPVTRISHLNVGSRVINGDVAAETDHTYAAFVYGDTHNCTGSVISDQYVITSAHCHKGPLRISNVIVGAHDINKFLRGQGERIDVEKVTVHPNYNTSGDTYWWNSDLAVIKLARPITQQNVKPIILPDISDERSEKVATFAGWGLTDFFDPSSVSPVLREAKNKMMSMKNCREEYLAKATGKSVDEISAKEKNIFYRDLGLGNSHVCGSSLGASAVGPGDSGGPLVIRSRDGNILVGVTSGTVGGGNEGNFPYVFASIANAREFINSNSVGHRWHTASAENLSTTGENREEMKGGTSGGSTCTAGAGIALIAGLMAGMVEWL